jgi:hypothetical protein
MTVGTDNVTFGDFGLDIRERTPSLAGGVGQVETLLLTGTMVKIHHVVRISMTAVGTGTIFGLTEQLTNAFQPILLQGEVIFLVALVVLPLIRAMAGTAPVLGFTVRPNPEVGQRQIAPAFRTILHRYPSWKSGRRDSNPQRPDWKSGALPLSYTRASRAILEACRGVAKSAPSRSGQCRIRTCVGRTRQIYSLVPLAARPTARRSSTRKLAVGLEPTTTGLQNQYSAIELR